MTDTLTTAGIVALPAPCLELLYRNSSQHVEVGDGTPHYSTDKEAREAAEQIEGMSDPSMGPIDVLERSAPCYVVTAVCGAQFDDDISHYSTREEAEQELRDVGWTLRGDGVVLCADTCCAEARATAGTPA